MSTALENRYLVGNFAPVSDELTAIDLPVEGMTCAVTGPWHRGPL